MQSLARLMTRRPAAEPAPVGAAAADDAPPAADALARLDTVDQIEADVLGAIGKVVSGIEPVFALIRVLGRHWGGFRTAYRL